MQLVMPSVNTLSLDESCSLNIALMKKIERCGRIAYRSEDKITDDSYIRFIKGIVSRKHHSVLEHARVVVDLVITEREADAIESHDLVSDHPFISIEYCRGYEESSEISVTGNLRALLEFVQDEAPHTPWVNRLTRILYKEFTPIFQDWYLENENWLDEHAPEQLDLPYTLKEDPDYTTFHVVTDRGVMAEWTRHRFNMSFTVESTRYCNYHKRGMMFCLPTPFDFSPTEDDNEEKWIYNWLKSIGCITEESKDGERMFFVCCSNSIPFEGHVDMCATFAKMNIWKNHMAACERAYNELIERGCTPQAARSVLPNSLKSEFCVTGTDSAWDHFLELRCAKDAHPQIRYLAERVKLLLCSGDTVG